MVRYDTRMGDEQRMLSQEELTRVLQKAAEIDDNEGPRRFSSEDAVAAGREMGLAPAAVEAALTYYQGQRPLPPALERPFDTRIGLETTDERLVLRIPPRGLHLEGLVKIGLGGMVMAFMAFWTRQAVELTGLIGPSPFGLGGAVPLFSIPFWVLGAGLLGSGLHAMVVGHRLELDRTGGRLLTLPYGRSRQLRPGQVRVRLDQIHARHRQHPGMNPVPVLAIDHGTKTYKLLAGASHAEQHWVKSELDRWLAG